MSTLTMAYFFWQVHFNAGMKAGTLAHEDLPAEELLGKVRLMYDNLPNFLKMGEFELTKSGASTSSGLTAALIEWPRRSRRSSALPI
jgi:hypothetical protein